MIKYAGVLVMILISLVSADIFAVTYYVSNSGNDTSNGRTAATAFKTLQRAVTAVAVGDTVLVADGTYKGFDLRKGGTATDPIVFKAQSNNALINTANGTTNDGINVEDASWVVIEGFKVNNQPRNGIRIVTSDHVVVRNNSCDANFERGILTGFANDLLIEGNTCTNSVDEHGIYVSNSGDRPIVRNNICHHNRASGIQMNADATLGGDGVIADGVIEGNIIYENGKGGGAAINLDGAVNTRIYNNLLYNNHATGIALFMIDAASGSENCKIYNNTIVNPSDGRWCVLIVNGSTGVTLYNNILINQHSFRGSIAMDDASRAGFVSNYNILVNRMSIDDGETTLMLAQWQALGYDNNSMLASSLTTLFVDPAAGNYHLKAGAQAIDKGTSLVSSLVTVDLDDKPRPSGSAYDIGTYEYTSSIQPINVKVNFQPASSAIPASYLADIGAVFGNRSNGYSYGWNVANNNTRDRKVSGVDARYNTLNHFSKPAGTLRYWEIALPNGSYSLIVGCGDPSFKDHINTLNVENVIVTDPDGKDNFDEYTVTVTVSDGRLTIKPASGAVNAKICFVDISQTSTIARLDIDAASPWEEMRVFPNPVVKQSINISYNAADVEDIKVIVFDEAGNERMHQWKAVSTGINNLQIDLSHLESGKYIIKVISRDRKEFQEVILKE